MNNWTSYQEKNLNNRITKSEYIDGRNYRIESETDFDVLNWCDTSIDVINRFDDEGEVQTINISNKSTDEIINELRQ